MNLTPVQLDELADAEYGAPATIKLDDGRALRVQVEYDQDTTIDDFDCYGKVAWVEQNRWSEHPAPRPDGFDGRALKLQAHGGDSFWWQPPYDQGMPADALKQARDLVVDLVSFGFHGVILELLEGQDAYGRPIVRDVASLWGIDTIEPEYVREIVSELVAELDDGTVTCSTCGRVFAIISEPDTECYAGHECAEDRAGVEP